MKLTVVHNGQEVPVVQAFIPTASIMDTGTVRVTIKASIPEAVAIIKNMEKGVVAWW